LISVTTLSIISILVIIGTILPVSNSKHWFVRGQAYFRMWYPFIHLLLISIWIFMPTINAITFILVFLLFICAVFCLKDILPFTRWYKKEIIGCSNREKMSTLNILIYNVYQKNDKYGKLIDKVNSLNPDIVLLLETNKHWQKAMDPLIKKYPYNIMAIQEDTYGMMILSKLEPIEKNIEQLTDQNIPSIDCLVKIKDQKIRIRCLHPKPPIPGEAMSSKQKDTEFMEAAKRIHQQPDDELNIIIGDLNDVVWSKASKRLKKESGLKDPRVGRGTFSTFPTYFPIRFPLDQIFCSSELLLSELKVLENIGSDHFPIYVEFCIPE